MQKVLVSGAGGQTASYMIEYLIENTDCEVVAIFRDNLGRFGSLKGKDRITPIIVDITDPAVVNWTIKKEKPDYFFNFAGLSSVVGSFERPVEYMEVNAISLIHILDAVKRHVPNCRVFSAGSITEEDPNSIYAVSKNSARQICKVYRENYGLYAAHGILCAHESERRPERFLSRKVTKGVARIYHAIKAGESFDPISIGNLDVDRDWSHALDFVDGIWRMMNRDVPLNDYVFSSNEVHSIREFVETAFLVANIQGVWRVPNINNESYLLSEDGAAPTKKYVELLKRDPKFSREKEKKILYGDSTKTREELGWEPKIGFDELVTRMVNYDIKNFKG